MTAKPRPNKRNGHKRSGPNVPSETDASGEAYIVGPGRPPKESQFKPGQSGNPKGRKRKPQSVLLDLKLLLERALNKTVTLKQGERERIITKAAAGIEQLVNQFAKGDRHARRDLIFLCDKLGVDLLAGHRQVVEEVLALNHQTILDEYVMRRTAGSSPSGSSPVIAPPGLLDDDPEH
jgi:hypothetical protein